MKKVEAPTLEEAYQKAAIELSCSITDLEYEVIQYASKGILGLMKKNAIIVASCRNKKSNNIGKVRKIQEEIIEIAKENKEIISKDTLKEEKVEKIEEVEKKSEEKIIEPILEKDTIVDNFFEADKSIDEEIDIISSSTEIEEVYEEESIIYDELALLIETQIKELFSHSCFAIDVVEVDVRDNTALIFIDGDDAALLIGKEGYRYNALSYMLFNWLHSKYELFIKLEIAEFLTMQEDMIASYIKPVIANVEKHGKGKTRFLDGILVQIALEQLRERFPDKYVAIKSTRDGKKFVVINQFNSTKPYNKSHA